MSGLEVNVPAFEPNVRMAVTDGWVLRWDTRGRIGDIYTLEDWNSRVETLAAGGTVLFRCPIDCVQVVEWDGRLGKPAQGINVNEVDLLEVLEWWIGGQS